MKYKTALHVTIPLYTTYSEKAAAAASEAILSGPFKAVGECLIYRFKRLPQQLQLHRKQQRRKGHQQENNKKKSNEQLLPQLQLQQQHKNGEPTAPRKPKTSTKPNTNTKSSLSLPSATLPSLQRLWNVFIILAWLLLTFNVNKVRAGSESTTAAAVTFSHNVNSTKLHAIIEEPSPSPPPPTVTVTRVTRINLTHSDHQPVVYPPKKKKHGIVAPSLATNNNDDNNNNEVIYVSSDEITTTTSDHIHSTSSPSSSSTITTPLPVSIYPSESFNDSSSFNATSYEGDIPEIPPYIRTTAMVFCIVIMLMGVIGNVMVSALAFALSLSHEL